MNTMLRRLLVSVALVVGTAAGLVLLLSGPASAAAPSIAEPGMLDGPVVLRSALGLLVGVLGAGLIGYAVWPEREPVRADERS